MTVGEKPTDCFDECEEHLAMIETPLSIEAMFHETRRNENKAKGNACSGWSHGEGRLDSQRDAADSERGKAGLLQ
jgi:hypothetical protein